MPSRSIAEVDEVLRTVERAENTKVLGHGAPEEGKDGRVSRSLLLAGAGGLRAGLPGPS
jgi:hypothetical protein